MNNVMQIRRYQVHDRVALRQLACDTADRGEPVEHFFRDREIFADVLTRYYTEWEPSSLWIAESDGDVVGYITGCLDARRYAQATRWSILPAAFLRGLIRGVLWQREAWQLAWAGWRTWQLTRQRRMTWRAAYPAHFHLNLRRDARGQGIGERLLEQFTEHARAARCPGLHAGVRSDNPSACRFFERLGFTLLERLPVVFPDRRVLVRRETLVYGRLC